MAHALLWDYGHKKLKLAQFLGQLGIFLTCAGSIWISAVTIGMDL